MQNSDSESELRHVAIRTASAELMQQLFLNFSLDYGCHPHVRVDDQIYESNAFVDDAQIEALRGADYDVIVLSVGLSDENRAATTVSQDNRFTPGNPAPRGPGANEGHDVGPIMNVDEIGDAIGRLAEKYPDDVTVIQLPNPSAEGEGGSVVTVGPSINPDDYHIFLIAGVHARERGGPDSTIYFVADILQAYHAGTGLVYGGKSFTDAEVKQVLAQGIVFFPCVNPDGIRYDQKTDSRWRKNRNPASAIAGVPESIGVDINRNYDFLWDLQRTFYDQVWKNDDIVGSVDPTSYQFHGTAPTSEAETRNVVWCLDYFKNLRWFMDIHSYTGDLLYSWGDDVDQVYDPQMNFQNPDFDGVRGGAGQPNPDYQEFIDEGDFGIVSSVARDVTNAMTVVSGRVYTPKQSFWLYPGVGYPTSGASDDYAYSRHIVDPGRSKTFGFTLEFGFASDDFYPTLPQFHNNLLEVCAGLVEFCLISAHH